MAEEQEKKQKRKTTLIKHRKPESSTDEGSTQDKSEKKKVVVVKKKVVKVKRPSGEPAAQKAARKTEQKTTQKAPPKAEEAKNEPRSAQPEKTERSKRPSRPGFLGSSPREPSPFDRYSKTGTARGGEAAEGRERTARMPSSAAGPETARGREARGRAGGRGTVQEEAGRRGRREPARAPQAGGQAEPQKGDEAKHGGKKFFKAKKKTAFQRKKHEEHVEKLMPVKKKTIRRANPVPKDVSILENITVSELAKKMNLKASELIGRLMKMGMMVTINQQIDSETAAILADEYDCKVNVVSLYDETVIEEEKDRDEDLRSRPPVVTVMGHVDHGKTKLLDAIRQTDVVAGEHGGITQHIGAYTVELPQGKVTFLDTPGHEAFTAMRARGAQITDIVVLVVAADDGVMPQTVEAVNHAKAANTPIIVAVNKIDLEDANPERVKQQLAEYDLLPEDWGGSTLYVEVSALKKQGIDTLLESILLQAEILELKASQSCRGQGTIIESKVDLGRGIVATVLVEKGVLRTGDSYVAGVFPGKVRAMFNDKGEKIDEALPATPVEILGLAGLPNAGDPFRATEDDKTARQIGSKRQELKKMESARNVNKITLDNLYDQIKQGEVQELKVIVKGDVHGSVEALEQALERLSTDEVRLSVIHSSAGAINDNDVLLSSAYNAIIVGFHVRPTPSAQSLADREKVEIRTYNVIYDVVDDIKAAMEGMLAPELREEVLGTAEVRDTFKVPKIGIIAGCYVVSGKVRRGAPAHVIRDGVQIYSGKISSLRRFKDDAREVDTGFECGIGIENHSDLKVGDQIEVFEIKEFAKTLEESRSDAGDQKEKD